MTEILQQRIEKAARHYLLNEHRSPLNEILHQCDLKTEMQYHRDIESAYIAGATFALQNQWISVEEALPNESGEYFVSNGARFREADYDAELHYWVNEPFLGCKFGSEDVTHWMMIPELPEGGEQ